MGRGQASELCRFRGVGRNFRLEQFFRSRFSYSCLHLDVWHRVLQATRTGAEAGGGQAEPPRSQEVLGPHGHSPFGDPHSGACGYSTPTPGEHGQGGCRSVHFLPAAFPTCWWKLWEKPKQMPQKILTPEELGLHLRSLVHSTSIELFLCLALCWPCWGHGDDHDSPCPSSWGSQSSAVDTHLQTVTT